MHEIKFFETSDALGASAAVSLRISASEAVYLIVINKLPNFIDAHPNWVYLVKTYT